MVKVKEIKVFLKQLHNRASGIKEARAEGKENRSEEVEEKSLLPIKTHNRMKDIPRSERRVEGSKL